ncbi:hypothetical protein SBRCBS47491_006484 [Sporothrix bragantina]|uniref:Rsc complex subunit n=1 Tax=Sporothrix bragantina TaxID=671064 RepID=A0ABP0C5A8_9PEZI
MTGVGVAEKRPGGGAAANASGEVHESIEAKPTAKAPAENMDADADADADADGDEDADGEADPDMDMDADGDADADGEADVEMTDAAIEVAPGGSDRQAQQAAFRAKRDLLHLIETTAHYLSSYEEDGIEIAGGFQRIPNKRVIPDYFDIIKEPTAFSTIRGRVQKRVYSDFTQFVRDVALICHNAQVYNRPSAPIFQYAVKLREVFKAKLQELVNKGSIQPKEAELPYLGEIPDFSPSPPAEEGDGDEDEDEDEDEEEEEESDDDDVDSETGRRRRRGPGARNSNVKKNGGAMASKMVTAMEGRVNNVIAGLQKAEDEDGDPLLEPFETLPDRELLPDYYEEIKNPIAVDIIQSKARRKIYGTIDDAMADFDLMFANAKLYNQDGSPIFEAAVKLQALARRLAGQERAKPDNAFRDEHGRLAVPGVQHLGQVWRVGDWVLLRNANDPGKPIVAQIFRMWFDATGHAWVNACWYYRPEQTVHRFDRHFYENEVIKSEQYRDHLFDDVLDRTFVMFSEQYSRGRPRGYPPNKTLYVCEYRYSEDTCRFTKIVKWEPCVPEEVRGLDILMDAYPAPRKFPKYPSPIKHLLDPNSRESDALPKPTWGNPNAPPMIGSVHRRPRLPNESPPPDPATLPPPTQNATSDMQYDQSRRVSMPGAPPQGFIQPGAVPGPGGMAGPGGHPGQSPSPHASAYAQQQFVPRPPPQGMPGAPNRGPGGGMPPNAHIQPSPHHHPMQAIAAHPSPVPQQGHLAPSPGPGGPMPGGSPHPMQHNSYNNSGNPNAPPHQQQLRQGPPTPVQHNQMMVPPPQQQQQQQPHHPGMVPPGGAGGYSQHFPPPQQQQQHRMPSTPMQAPQPPVRQTPIMPPVPPHHHQPHQQPQQQQQQQQHHQSQTIAPPPVPNGYIPPRATSEAFVLPEAVDSTIPENLRKHYHRDDKGRVLFFTAPSVGHSSLAEDNVRAAPEYAGLGHSVRYLNGLEQFREERRLKRKARDEQLAAEQKEAEAQQAAEREAAAAQLYNAAGEALGGFVQWMNDGTRLMFEAEAGSNERKKQATTAGRG